MTKPSLWARLGWSLVTIFLVLTGSSGLRSQTIPTTFTDQNWVDTGAPALNGTVQAMVRRGNDLYVAGDFTLAGGLTVNRIARWDGAAWSVLGTGFEGSLAAPPFVDALALDAAGNLYVGGTFTSAGGVPAANIAKWDGTAWSALGSGVNNTVVTLAFDPAGRLHAGGAFTMAGGIAANAIAKWDGTTWSPLGSGLRRFNGITGIVCCLAFDPAGNLYTGGLFARAGEIAAANLAKWDGTVWSPLGSGASGALATPYVLALAFSPRGELHAGGEFSVMDGITVNGIAKWNGTAWSGLGAGFSGSAPSVSELLWDASDNLLAAGYFSRAGAVEAPNVASWDGTSWSALGSGVAGSSNFSRVNSLCLDRYGETVFVGGSFTTAGGKALPYLAQAQINPQRILFRLSAVSLGENNPPHTTVGTLEATALALGSATGFALISGPGSEDNAAFTLTGSSLVLNESADFETKTSYTLRVQATFANGSTYEKPFKIDVLNARDTPIENWRQTYFGTFANSGPAGDNVDLDGDTSTNLQEFQNGTDPTSASSAAFALTVSPIGVGSVTAVPAKALYQKGETVTLTATPTAFTSFLNWSGAATGSTNPKVVTVNADLFVYATFKPLFPVALETTGLAWTTTGNFTWFAQDATTHDGVDAAQSGSVNSDLFGYSDLTTTVTGPGELTFWWKFSGGNYDSLRLMSDSVETSAELRTTSDWVLETVFIPYGQHTLSWEHSHYGNTTASPRAGWLDQVAWQPDPALKAWYEAHFTAAELANTNVITSGFDSDNDGSTNLQEYQNGTDPRDASSARFPLTVSIFGAGTVTVSPDLPLYDKGTVVTLTPAATEPSSRFQGWNGGASGSSQPLTVTITAATNITATFELDLHLSLETEPANLTWNRGGDSLWFGQTATTHDGADAAQSGQMTFGKTSWIETTVEGPGTLSFWWKLSSVSTSNRLSFSVDGGSDSSQLFVNTDWARRSVTLPPGSHTLRWIFENLNYGDPRVNPNTGFLDQIEWRRDTALNTWYHAHFTAEELNLAYLSGLSADPDRDGVSNLDEYQRGTDPRDPASLAYAVMAGANGPGHVSLSPAPIYVVPGSRVTLTAIPDPLSVFLGWSGPYGISNPLEFTVTRDTEVTATFVPDVTGTLGPALETTAFTWTGSGNPVWTAQTATSHDGSDAAQSAPVGYQQESAMQTLVTGPGDLTFWTKLSTLRFPYSRLTLRIDRVNVEDLLVGTVDWTEKTHFIPAGTHEVAWVLRNDDPSGPPEATTAWVDQITWRPDTALAAWYDAHFTRAEQNNPTLSDLFSDPDFDGSLNQDEYRFGSDPRDPASTRVILTLDVTGDGSVVSSPAPLAQLSPRELVYEKGSAVTLTALPGAQSVFASWFPEAFGITPTATVTISSYQNVVASFDAIVTSALEPALDTSGLVWATSPLSPWLAQTGTTHDGLDAVQSGPINDFQSTSLQTTVTGPGYVGYWWKMTKDFSYDYAVLQLDGVPTENHLFNNSDWTRARCFVPAGTHRLTWTYFRRSSDGSGGFGYGNETGGPIIIGPGVVVGGEAVAGAATRSSPKTRNAATFNNAIALDQVTWQPETSLGAWYDAHFTRAEQNNPALSGPAADPDGDGVCNLVEFALGRSPVSADATPVLRPLREPSPAGAEELVLRVPHAASLGQAYVRFQSTPDLPSQVWTDLTNGQDGVSITDTDGQFVVRLPLDSHQLYFRLVVTLP